MATYAVSPDQDLIQADVQIAAPPERVFQALTDPRQIVQWWGQKGIYRHSSWNSDLRTGGKWRCEGVGDADGTPYHVGGEYVEVDPPRVLSYTWLASWSGELNTLVRFELEAASGGTLLHMRHSGFAEAPAAAKGHYDGWQRVIGWLQAYVERGETIDTRPAKK